MESSHIHLPITEISIPQNVRLFVKREDLIHPEISGNKYWKLYYNVKSYLSEASVSKKLVTFGGAYSNNLLAVAAAGAELQIPTLGIVRGDELQSKFKENFTLRTAAQMGMQFRFVSREDYRNKALLSQQLQQEFPTALILPEGGTNSAAVQGVQHMLDSGTESFDYLCTAVGTGGTVAGLSKFAAEGQQVLGFTVVQDTTLPEKIMKLSGRANFRLLEADNGGYGKISDEIVRFINSFLATHGVPLEPVYTGKMFQHLLRLIDEGFFPENSRILAFHTGGLQGRHGANEMLQRQGRPLLNM